jgi:hypothetical protein
VSEGLNGASWALRSRCASDVLVIGFKAVVPSPRPADDVAELPRLEHFSR